MDNELYDVLAVNMGNHKVRLIGEGKTARNADAIEMMAIGRLGVEEEFFVTVQAGKYKNGDEWDESSDV